MLSLLGIITRVYPTKRSSYNLRYEKNPSTLILELLYWVRRVVYGRRDVWSGFQVTLCGVDAMIEELVERPPRVEVVDICVNEKLIARCVPLWLGSRAGPLDGLGHAQPPVVGFVVEKGHLCM